MMASDGLEMYEARPREPTRPIWLGIAVDHRRLLDGLQDEWLRPVHNSEGHLLGIGRYCREPAEGPENRIIVRAQIEPATMPTLEVMALGKDAKWRAAYLNELRPSDIAVFWPGVLPLLCIGSISVATSEELARLTGQSKHVSNVLLPRVQIEPLTVEQWLNDTPPPPPLSDPGLRFPEHVDSCRGAASMALWACPRVDPWLELLCATLARAVVPSRLWSAVDASWWAHPPWFSTTTAGEAETHDPVWVAAVTALKTIRRGDSWDVHALIRAIAQTAAAAGAPETWARSWLTETERLVRAEKVLDLQDWRRDPVGKAVQLVLLRPDPFRFKSWIDDVPRLPPAIWWSGAVLCGLLCGYRHLPALFRGDLAQRRLLAIRGLGGSGPLTDVIREGQPTWRREGGMVILRCDGIDFAAKQESPRTKWFSANLQDPDTSRAAAEVARTNQWPCQRKTVIMRGGAVNLTGPGALRLTGDVHRSLLVEGEIYFTLPPDAHILEEFDLVGFRHCVATEGGQDIPAPPSKDYELSGRPVPSVRSTVAHERIDGLFYIAPFVGENEADDVVRSIDSAPWRRDLKRRVQHYGWRYDYRDHAVDESMHLGPLPPWAQRLAERLHREGHLPHVADQVIVNEYVEKQGISKHVDCEECFEDGIAMLSLLEPWEMVFRRGKEKIGIELEPRSVAVMKGDARYAWSHEIPARLTEPSGLRRRRRLSVTFRKVIPSSAQPKKKTRKR